MSSFCEKHLQLKKVSNRKEKNFNNARITQNSFYTQRKVELIIVSNLSYANPVFSMSFVVTEEHKICNKILLLKIFQHVTCHFLQIVFRMPAPVFLSN